MKIKGKDTNKADMPKVKAMIKKKPKANTKKDKGSSGEGKMSKAKAVTKKEKK